MTIYLQLSEAFNQGRTRAILSSGQAVVFHRLAVMSKDGDWIIREDQECTDHILSVLSSYGAVYRYGAPLDVRWLRGGWSSHLEFSYDGLRIRTDFVSRPPRVSPIDLEKLWRNAEGQKLPVVEPRVLIELKKTAREKDYPVIGELSRLLSDVEEQLLCSRSARDIIALLEKHPYLLAKLSVQRPLLLSYKDGRDVLERVLDEERRDLLRTDEERLKRYAEAARQWGAGWQDLAKPLAGLSLKEAHKLISEKAVNSGYA